MGYLTSINGVCLHFQVACQRILLMMNNTELLSIPRLSSIDEALMYLQGLHADVGLSGDRGDLYRRKLAEQMYLNFRIQGVNHNNVVQIVAAALDLEKQTRRILSDAASNRDVAPPILLDDQILNILAKIADVF